MATALRDQASAMVIRIADRQPGQDDPIWDQIKELAKKLKKKPDPPTEAEQYLFESFRQKYKTAGGSVRGLQVEMNDFVRKHLDWRDALLILHDNHDRQIKERRWLADNAKHLPEWPHLQTYISQRRWDMVYANIPVSNIPEEKENKYTQWLRSLNLPLPFSEVILKSMLLQDAVDYFAFKGKFESFPIAFPMTRAKDLCHTWHLEYFSSKWYRNTYPTVTEFIINRINESLQ